MNPIDRQIQILIKEFHNPKINPAAKELIRRKLLDALEEKEKEWEGECTPEKVNDLNTNRRLTNG